MSSRASETSNRYNAHRAASTVVRTFLVVLVAGAFISLAARPTYRCTVKLFLEENAKLASTAPYARKTREMQRAIDLHQSTVDLLTKSVEELRLRSKMMHDPMLIISPAKSAQQISPNRMRYVFNSAVLGVILGLFAAGLQLFVRKP